jgi:hypothetical protein
MIGGTLALGPLLILGAVLLPAATQGLLHLQIPNTGSGRGPTPAHLLTAGREAGAPTRRDTADPHEERGLSLLPDEVVCYDLELLL